MILTTITLLGTWAFLWWFWLISHRAIHVDPPPPIWWKIVHKNLVTQVVTIATAVLRTSLSLQAGIITAMVASLLLEHQGSRIETFPMLSVVRGVYTSPLNFFFSHWPPLRAWTFAWLLAISLIITLESQFFSTILVTDIKPSQVSFDGNKSLVAGLDTSQKLRDPGLWMRRPLEFPVYAERRNLYIPEDGLFETGHTYRAFPPLPTQQNRTNLREFRGGAMLLDARVACVPPRLTLKSAHKYGNPYASDPKEPFERAFQGTVGLNISEYPFLDTSYKDKYNLTRITSFNCTISLPSKGTINGIGHEWTVGLCIIDPVFRLNYNLSRYPEGLLNQDSDPTYSSEYRSFLLLNITGDSRDWYDFALPNLQQWAKNGLLYIPEKNGTIERKEQWTTWIPRNSSVNVAVAASWCFTSGFGGFTKVVMRTKKKLEEHTPRIQDPTYLPEETRWYTGSTPEPPYKSNMTMAIRETYDVTKDIDKRNVLRLDFLTFSDGILDSPTGKHMASRIESRMNPPLMSYGPPPMRGSTLDTFDQSKGGTILSNAIFRGLQTSARPPSNSTALLYQVGTDMQENMPFTHLNYIYTCIFQDILRETGHPARAIQAILTIASQTAFYDRLQELNDPLERTITLLFAESFAIPSQWTGFKIVGLTLAVHVLCLFVTCMLFLSRTRKSLLGNVWISVSQIITNDTLPILKEAQYMTDGEVTKAIKASGRDGQTVHLRKVTS
jgi:hypothetical protein